VGVWLLLIGGALFALTTLGMVFEHYMGEWRRT
jgi:disulfide bond formation protein DsbB